MVIVSPGMFLAAYVVPHDCFFSCILQPLTSDFKQAILMLAGPCTLWLFLYGAVFIFTKKGCVRIELNGKRSKHRIWALSGRLLQTDLKLIKQSLEYFVSEGELEV